MRRLIFLALLSAPLAGLPAQAQEILPPPSAGGVPLVDSWIRQYMRRAPSRQDLANGAAIDAGTVDPASLLAGILSCDEYYSKRAGSDDARYIQTVFRDLTGRRPSQREVDYWAHRLQDAPAGMDGRTEVVQALFDRYPPNLAPPLPPIPERRP